jgi:phosphonate metabolism-associated iron-containing alcohol dehydrogenase
VNTFAWSHHNPVRIQFGRGCRASAAGALTDRRALIVCSPRGRQQLESDPLLCQVIQRTKSLVWIDSVEPNPSLNRLQELCNDLQSARLDCVIGFGGGSAIDSAKTLALALSPAGNHRSLRELLDSVGSLPLGVALPLHVLPTTAGTGSEVTPYATIWDHFERRKLSLAGLAVYPATAYIDPSLSDTVPYNSTLSTGLDAINQAAESIWNRNITPMSEMLAHRALELGIGTLPRLLNDLGNTNLRDNMAAVSLLAGLAISQTRTALCHAISYPLTAHFGVSHGLACAFTMPAVLRHNLGADDGRFRRLAVALEPALGTIGIVGLVRLFERFNHELDVAHKIRIAVGDLGALLALTDEMFSPGRAENSLKEVTHDSVKDILKISWGAI